MLFHVAGDIGCRKLHYKLFRTGFEEAHNAAADIKATVKCFRELKRRGIL